MDINTKIEQWMSAMLVGKYQFGSGSLVDDKGCHCALGVYFDMFGPEPLKEKFNETRKLDSGLSFAQACNKVYNWLGDELSPVGITVTEIYRENDMSENSYSPVIALLKERTGLSPRMGDV